MMVNNTSVILNAPAAVAVTVVVGGLCFIAWKNPRAFEDIVKTVSHSVQTAYIKAISA